MSVRLFASVTLTVKVDRPTDVGVPLRIPVAGPISSPSGKDPEVIAHLVEDGFLWIAYPKRSSKVKTDLSRDLFWEILLSHGYRAVTHVYIDPVWTAMRFRHVDFIGS